MTTAAFELELPELRSTSVVFTSPHSGRDYSAQFLRRAMLDEHEIRSSEDAFIDLIFGAARRHGAPLLAARSPRAYVDLNRAADELDPALIDGVRRSAHNPRIASGLGVIPRVVSNGRPIYRGKLPMAEALARIDAVWRPFHAALARLLDESQQMFGESILIDCHSMPHEALEAVTAGGGPPPQVVLGDRFGAAARPAIVDRLEAIFAEAGLRVARNMPFAGAYITQSYGRPSRRQHAVQVEIDRALYLDERRVVPNANFEPFRRLMESVVAEIAAMGRPADVAMAAE